MDLRVLMSKRAAYMLFDEALRFTPDLVARTIARRGR